MTDWIAADWGTSNLRLWGMTGGEVSWRATSERGMATLDPSEFERALEETIADRAGPDVPVVACGMVGARQGWAEARYASVPARPLGASFTRAPGRREVRIVPGLSQADPPDVMRGEETQVAGLLSISDFDGVACLPGTHTKWVQVSAGEIVSFRTAMTGELFALLSERSVLRHSVEGAMDEEAFDAAVSDAISRPERIAADLFGIRAAHLLDGVHGPARLSGLLVGAELAAMRPYWLGQEIRVCGAPRLAALYARALDAQGAPSTIHDVEAATLAGLAAARETT